MSTSAALVTPGIRARAVHGFSVPFLKGQTGRISALAMSPNGKSLYVSFLTPEKYSVEAYNVFGTSEVEHAGSIIPVADDEVYVIAPSEDGTYVAAGGYGRTVIVADALSGVELVRLRQPADAGGGSPTRPPGASVTAATFCASDHRICIGTGIGHPAVYIFGTPRMDATRENSAAGAVSGWPLLRRFSTAAVFDAPIRHIVPAGEFILFGTGRQQVGRIDLRCSKDNELVALEYDPPAVCTNNDFNPEDTQSMCTTRADPTTVLTLRRSVIQVHHAQDSPRRSIVLHMQPHKVNSDIDVNTVVLGGREHVVTSVLRESSAEANRAQGKCAVAPLQPQHINSHVEHVKFFEAQRAAESFVPLESFSDGHHSLVRPQLLVRVPGVPDTLVFSSYASQKDAPEGASCVRAYRFE